MRTWFGGRRSKAEGRKKAVIRSSKSEGKLRRAFPLDGARDAVRTILLEPRVFGSRNFGFLTAFGFRVWGLGLRSCQVMSNPILA